MRTCIHAYIHVYMHAYMHAYMHTYMQTYIESHSGTSRKINMAPIITNNKRRNRSDYRMDMFGFDCNGNYEVLIVGLLRKLRDAEH